jgi:putative redox protein
MTRFDFVNRNGKTLSGQLELPSAKPIAYALFAHCFTCSKNVKAASQVSRRLAENGFAVLRFDFTGLGNSEGDFANSDFSSNVTDLADAADALRERQKPPSLLVGHSLGGAAALIAAGDIASVRAVATIGAPSEPAHVEHLISKTTVRTNPDGSTTIKLGGRELRIGKQFVDDLNSHRIASVLPKSGKPLLIFHSPVDSVVSIDNARELYQSAKHPKSFISVDGADHMLSNPDDADYVASSLATWAARYLPSPDYPLDVEPVPDGAVEVNEQATSLMQLVRTPTHEFFADEPFNVGGKDRGPNPYELLLASLGACTSMTLRLYANRKKWPLKSISVRLAHSRVHAVDCESCDSKDGRIDRINKTITVSGDLDNTQLARLAEIADRCPVHRTLINEKQIVSRLELAETD